MLVFTLSQYFESCLREEEILSVIVSTQRIRRNIALQDSDSIPLIVCYTFMYSTP